MSMDEYLPDSEAAELYRRMGIRRGGCKVCGVPFWAEFSYQKAGACADCVSKLANMYWKAHSGQPHPDFATEEDLAEHRPRKPQKRPIPESLRWDVFERDGHRCRRCGSGRRLCADHIEPESKGGPMTLDNLQPLCRSCNSKKGVKA